MANDAGVGMGQAGFGFGEAVAPTAEETPKTRDQIRSKRKHPVRAKSENMERLTKLERLMNQAEYPASELAANDRARPKTRAECPPVGADGKRHCPWLACCWHLKLDVNEENGTIRDNFPDIDFDQMVDTCALDVADEGGATLDRVAEAEGCTRERVRQIEVKALGSVPGWARKKLAGQLDGGPEDKRRLPFYRMAMGPQHVRGFAPSQEPFAVDPNGRASRTERSLATGATRGVSFGGSKSVGIEGDGVDWSARERTLRRVAERLGRATAVGLLRASGLPSYDLGPVHRMAANGLIRREGNEYVWVGA